MPRVLVSTPNQALRLGTITSNTSNTAITAANALSLAMAAYALANTALQTADSPNTFLVAIAAANAAANLANNAAFLANSAAYIAVQSGLSANAANNQATYAANLANSAYTGANAANSLANTANNTATLAYNAANSVNDQLANLNVFTQGLSSVVGTLDGLFQTAIDQSDQANDTANNAANVASNAQSYLANVNTFVSAVNTSLATINASIVTADFLIAQVSATANGLIANVSAVANAAYSNAAAAINLSIAENQYITAVSNSLSIQIGAANATAVASYGTANGAYSQANSAYNQANIANTIATTALADAANALAEASNVSTIVLSQSMSPNIANQTQFTLSANVSGAAYVLVSRNGILQIPTVDYNVTSNNILTLTSNTDSDDVIETRVFESVTVASLGNVMIGMAYDQSNLAYEQSNIALQLAEAAGILPSEVYNVFSNTSSFVLPANTSDANNVLVSKNGIVQIPNEDYILSGFNTIVLTTPAMDMDVVEIRMLGSGVSINPTVSLANLICGTVNVGNVNVTSFYISSNISDANNVMVSKNGLILDPGVDYTLSQNNFITLTANSTNGDRLLYRILNVTSGIVYEYGGTGGGNSSGSLVVTGTITCNTLNVGSTQIFSSTQVTTMNGSNVMIDTFPASLFSTAHYLVQITAAGIGVQSSELLVLNDGINLYVNEFADVYSNGILGVLTANIYSGSVNLNLNPTNPAAAIFTIKTVRQTITV